MLARVLEPEVMDTAEDAREYDAIPNTTVNAQLVREALALGVSEGSALDLGTGPGEVITMLAEAAPGLRVFGVDLADEMLSIAREAVRRSSARDRIVLERRDVKRTGYADASFDLIVCNSVVHHLPDPVALFAEVRRLMSGRAAVLIRDLLRPTSQAALAALVREHTEGASAYQRRLFADSLHAALTLDEVRAACHAAGLPGSVAQTSDRHWTWTVPNHGAA